MTANVYKHAGAKLAVVKVNTVDDDLLQVAVSDDGVGIKINQKRSGIDISNIEYRVTSFAGTKEIESDLGSGCTIKIKIPC